MTRVPSSTSEVEAWSGKATEARATEARATMSGHAVDSYRLLAVRDTG